VARDAKPGVLPRIPFHPFLTAAYPVLALLALNAPEIRAGQALRSLAFSLALAAALLLLLRLVLRTWTRAAILTTVVLLLFFSYGHLYVLLRASDGLAAALGRHRYLATLCLALIIVVAIYLWRRDPSPALTTFLNLGTMLAVILTAGQSVWRYAEAWSPGSRAEPVGQSLPALSPPSDAPLPDVYYIILDSYPRADVLDEAFGFDNTSFLQSLEAMGFEVASQSRSNYAVTRLSIPSSLNMNYLDTLGPAPDPEARDAAWIDRAAKSSLVRESLEALGYKVIAFESAIGTSDWVDSDVYLSPRPTSLSDAVAFGRLNALEVMLIQTSMGRLVIDGRVQLNAWLQTEIQDPYESHRELILFTLDRLSRLGEVQGPKFVFAHIMCPHAPIVFTADGRPVESNGIFTLAEADAEPAGTSLDGYRGQLTYLNSRLLEVMSAILRSSDPRPIIVLQGDHGAQGVGTDDRMKILNAYYLPGLEPGAIDESITPVNTFRVVFNRYFGADLPLLEDRSYFSTVDAPFVLTLVP
jgi:hypothetical protein